MLSLNVNTLAFPAIVWRGSQGSGGGRDTRVQDVMERVGFGNFSHFSRAYKQAYGYAPSKTV